MSRPGRPGRSQSVLLGDSGLNADGKLLAYHDRSDGGLLVTLLEMAFAAHAGLEIKLDWLIDEPPMPSMRCSPRSLVR